MNIQNIQNFQDFHRIQNINPSIPRRQSAGATAIAGQLGVIHSKETFGTYNIEKLKEVEKTQKSTKIEFARPKFLEFINGLDKISSQSTLEFDKKTNLYSANYSSGILKNIPLGNNAIYSNNGFSGAKLNVIV